MEVHVFKQQSLQLLAKPVIIAHLGHNMQLNFHVEQALILLQLIYYLEDAHNVA